MKSGLLRRYHGRCIGEGRPHNTGAPLERIGRATIPAKWSFVLSQMLFNVVCGSSGRKRCHGREKSFQIKQMAKYGRVISGFADSRLLRCPVFPAFPPPFSFIFWLFPFFLLLTFRCRSVFRDYCSSSCSIRCSKVNIA